MLKAHKTKSFPQKSLNKQGHFLANFFNAFF